MKIDFKQLCENFSIHEQLSLEMLSRARKLDEDKANLLMNPQKEIFIPHINGTSIIDGRDDFSYSINKNEAIPRIKELLPELDLYLYTADSQREDEIWRFSREGLTELGYQLSPFIAYGILNGGSATSYIDKKKNSGFFPPLYSLIHESFSKLAEIGEGLPKGLTPAYINPNGTPGFSFLELKTRALSVFSYRASKKTGIQETLPIIQMSSGITHKPLIAFFSTIQQSPLIQEFTEAGFPPFSVATEQQPLIAALTAETAGEQRNFFTQAWQKENTLLPLPGGHGQNFAVLKEDYHRLYHEGKRFCYLVNVDNLGNTPEPSYIAVTALSGSQGSFEFSVKTPIDVKGGILTEDSEHKLSCGDIGVAISPETVIEAEKAGKAILFNCATGLFNLKYLHENLDEITHGIPVRISEQNKDSGKYAQAEQVTWEIIDLMENPLIISVHKSNRFLAAKLLSEAIVTTKADELVPLLLNEHPEYQEFCNSILSAQLGFSKIMREVYAMRLVNGEWEPIPLNEIE